MTNFASELILKFRSDGWIGWLAFCVIALAQNLLGVSFLSRLKRYEVASGLMVLEQ